MVRIEWPCHGAVLNRRHGDQDDRGLTIRVSGRAPVGDTVSVNGARAMRRGESFEATVLLQTPQTELVATTNGSSGAATHGIRVVWDRYSRKRYRFSIDDNSFFLRDIAQSNYRSLFDCFYLEGLRDLHRRYGTKFALNVFFSTPQKDLTLADVPDTYRDEWEENADWLKLAFHAYNEFPDRPYQYASPEKLGADMDAVVAEIHRFAGEAACAPPTVLHWGMCPPACLDELSRRGVTVLSGFFEDGIDGRPDVNYNLDEIRNEHVRQHGCVMDVRSGIIFSKIHIVCNNTPVAETVPTLNPFVEGKASVDVLDLFTHEQYFWSFYKRYVPDHFERLETAIAYAAEHGYEPIWLHEGLLGGRHPEDRAGL